MENNKYTEGDRQQARGFISLALQKSAFYLVTTLGIPVELVKSKINGMTNKEKIMFVGRFYNKYPKVFTGLPHFTKEYE